VMLVAAGLIVAAGCGEDGSTDTTATDTITLPASSAGKVYWLRDGKVWPVARELPATDTAAAALDELLSGPSSDEEGELEATTAVPSGAEFDDVQVVDGVASLTVSEELSSEALAQVVYTLTQFPTITSVEIDGKTYTRKSFEEQTPAILVESPLPFADVTSPITSSGTANTFEASFNYEVYDVDGNMVDENFVTATSGTGTRGTFEFTTGDFDSISKLVVFEPSAEDGSKTKLVEIPLSSS
jgi:immunoglobulin-like protein involved in spore germination/sporulation and spore germination protein